MAGSAGGSAKDKGDPVALSPPFFHPAGAAQGKIEKSGNYSAVLPFCPGWRDPTPILPANVRFLQSQRLGGRPRGARPASTLTGQAISSSGTETSTTSTESGAPSRG